MSEPVKLPVDQDVEVTCPHCGNKFFHKVGHFFKSAGIAIAETAVTILVSATGAGGDN